MWEVTYANPKSGSKESVSYTSGTLLGELVRKAGSTPSSYDQEEFYKEFVQGVTAEAALNTTPAVLCQAAFRLGYLYRVFLERNDVVCPKGPSVTESDSSSSGDSK